MSSWDADPQYTEHKLTEVAAGAEGWTLSFDGFGIFCPKDKCEQSPVVGEAARLYGKGLGYSVRGIIIEGRVYSYLTEEQDAERHANWVAERKRSRQALEQSERADRDARRDALPEALRHRLLRFEIRNPEWRSEFEPYELFVCEEAARLAAHFGSDVEALRVFVSGTQSEQAAGIPALKLGEHSGNTWGMAVELAKRLMVDPKLVQGAHGALCALVGCSEYGCPGAEAKETNE